MKAATLILIATMMMPFSASAGFNAFINGEKLHDKSRAVKIDQKWIGVVSLFVGWLTTHAVSKRTNKIIRIHVVRQNIKCSTTNVA
ncbi:hypothetical protein [Methylobacter sp.]|uniref:hypothetical protein n=1 Tax=Methylobacter sp. TaxID=2051955 RepID=UPI00248A84BF|nr:hypothetical protein [Methylobacter sp.]MDI1279673.1 hypothetical protein [Methylobacter sp.]MDI1358566.1 hypothetical protein [Methylobacter sp.]